MRRIWFGVLAALIAIVYLLIAFEVARCRYLLVNDYIAFSMTHIGAWPSSIVESFADFSSPGAWLFRPFPDAMAWMFSMVFREHPGTWHVVLVLVRLLSVALAFAIAREFSSSPAAIAVGAAFFAFFPAIPEIDLLRAENWLIPSLAATFLGWLRLSRGANGVAVAWTAAAFVLATMSKEIAAPLMAALFVLLAPRLWRRGTEARVILALMFVAVANQAARCVLIFSDPYAQGSGTLLDRLLPGAFWTAKVLLLAATSFPGLSLILAVLFVLGALGLMRRSKGAAVLLLLSLGLAIAAPYPAIRYIYPAALFLVPCVVAGIDELRRLAGDRAAGATAAATLALLAIFCGASLWAQAAAMRASTRADWRLLEEAAGAFANGRDVVILEDADFERSFWIRAELVGVDPRWPFLSYVARQYAAGEPVVWPPAPAGPVNLTGRVPARPRAQLRNIPVPDALVIPANPFVERVNPPGGWSVSERFDDRDGFASAQLHAFARFARMLNPRFHYAVDLGESPFPGHYWVTLSSSRRISRAGLPPTSVKGGTSRVTTDAAATTAPRPR